MFSLEREITELRDAGVLANAQAAPLIAAERRDVVNLYAELRVLTWAGVMLIAAGAGVLVAKNIQRIGPLTLAVAIGAAAAACYAWAFWKRKRETSLAGDYILLLGALLLSADVGYLELTYHFFGAHWTVHLLLLAVIHAVTAYVFDSRLVLSIALGCLAGYFGIKRDWQTLFGANLQTAFSALLCAAIVLAWRVIDALVRTNRTFTAVFEHFAANLAFWGSLVLTADQQKRWIGCAIALAFAIASAIYGFRTRRETFVVYACVYALIALNMVAFSLWNDAASAAFATLSTIVTIVALLVIHARMQRDEVQA